MALERAFCVRCQMRMLAVTISAASQNRHACVARAAATVCVTSAWACDGFLLATG